MILFMIDNFVNQIIHAIKKIRDLRQRPDADRIFRTITKDAATNMSLADVQQKIGQMISSSQLQNKPFQVYQTVLFYQTVSKRIIVYAIQL